MDKKVAVVTGSLRGLGREAAKQLAKKGYHVLLTGRDESRGKIAQAEFAKQGMETSFFFLDVANSRSIESFAKTALQNFGKVDVLVNNAGIMIDSSEKTLSDYEHSIKKTFETNTLGPFLLCQALVPAMMKEGFGRIVNISSGMGQLTEMNSGHPAYRISKTALNAVTRMFADQTKGTDILVNSACPGWVRTDMGGQQAPRSLEEGADTIVWLATLPMGAETGGFFRDRKRISW